MRLTMNDQRDERGNDLAKAAQRASSALCAREKGRMMRLIGNEQWCERGRAFAVGVACVQMYRRSMRWCRRGAGQMTSAAILAIERRATVAMLIGSVPSQRVRLMNGVVLVCVRAGIHAGGRTMHCMLAERHCHRGEALQR